MSVQIDEAGKQGAREEDTFTWTGEAVSRCHSLDPVTRHGDRMTFEHSPAVEHPISGYHVPVTESSPRRAAPGQSRHFRCGHEWLHLSSRYLNIVSVECTVGIGPATPTEGHKTPSFVTAGRLRPRRPGDDVRDGLDTLQGPGKASMPTVDTAQFVAALPTNAELHLIDG